MLVPINSELLRLAVLLAVKGFLSLSFSGLASWFSVPWAMPCSATCLEGLSRALRMLLVLCFFAGAVSAWDACLRHNQAPPPQAERH